MEVPMAPWRVMAAMRGWCSCLKVLWDLAVGPLSFRSSRSQARHGGVKAGLVLKNTRRLASKWEASHRHRPLTSSSRSEAICDFFERPSAIGQAGDGPPNGGGGDPLPKLLLESLAVLF